MKFCFTPHGILALDPRAFGVTFDSVVVHSPEDHDGVSVVHVRGPLMHHADPLCMSYDEIKASAKSALASASCKAVLLSIDSPGGLVSGCFDTVRELRAMAQAAGKPLYAHVSTAASAAYALACAASKIWISEAGIAGSIGTVDTVLDATAVDAAMGLRFAIVASGARKADGNPHVKLSEETLNATQSTVNALAEMFFGLVSETRGLSVDTIRDLEARIMTGAEAAVSGLADGVATFDQVLALIASGNAAAPADVSAAPSVAGSKKMGLSKAVVAALLKDADKDDDEGNAAKKALATHFGGDEKPEEKPEAKAEDAPEDQEKKQEEKPEAKAEDYKEKPEAKAEDYEEKPEAKAKSEGAQALAAVARIERSTLLASRPDFSAEIKASLATAPLETVRFAVANFPKVVSPVQGAIAALSAKAPTAGEQTDSSKRDGYTLDELDAQMGLRAALPSVKHDGTRTSIPVMTPDQARALLAAKKGASK